MKTADFDVFVMGGGINGAGIAVDCAGRGLKVGLCEKDDLAGATSSSSSKLIHGGLRYLEHYEFRLVREALAEREVLLKIAPHIARPMRFCLPHRPQLRPAWLIRAGLFLYDYLSSRVSLPGSQKVWFSETSPLKSEFVQGFEYSDAWVDDARLVVLNAMSLQRLGGTVLTRTEAVKAWCDNQLWHVLLKDRLTGRETEVTCHALVNAAGPWVSSLFDSVLSEQAPRRIRLIKGSHIVVPKLHDEPRAFILQNQDGRIVFVTPWLEQFSLIGTTDVEYNGDPVSASCSEEEQRYLCDVVNQHFKNKVSPEDVIWSYSGVRPLCEDESDSPQAITRDYTIELEDVEGRVPLLSVFGGKLTTYRKLAEAASEKLSGYFPEMRSSWTADHRLPGTDGFESPESFIESLQNAYPWLSDSFARRLCQSYGSLSRQWLQEASSPDDLGQYFGADLYAAEVDYLILNEWAYSVDDILWRRSKLGMFLSDDQAGVLEDYLRKRLPELVPERFSPSESDILISQANHKPDRDDSIINNL
ncbi:glycerol-3-phosphate dehydrogenase [Endozoicomonas gorgoniicola]|uniref:Glycerol-3-phosphate dehydrogenase n=2 Tax=Endozoicomonas gorgoniicola TaxID=1234144 RepID=A0ABT3N432_9GAMM|nr:glycerol-3-phosphate dehydrogenase [Endozoicomonas gorgoniicola]MCW7556403.1 glycerol-3-phosphate dehydrogenase [Endozoicomonas gorgoniicola]